MKARYIKRKLTNLLAVNKIVTIHYFEFDRNFIGPVNQHDFWEMVYLDKGEATITAGKKQLTLRQGECYFHKPNEVHQIAGSGKVDPYIFIISFVCHSASMHFFVDKLIQVPEKLQPLIGYILREGKASFRPPFNDPELKELTPREDALVGGEQLIRVYLEQLLVLLLRKETTADSSTVFPSRKNLENHLANTMKEKLDSTVYTRRISVEELCRELGYSRAYLSRVFRENHGYTMTEYYDFLKITEAKKLIREGSRNFTQIADLLCFSNPLYFSRVFRRVTGMSPSEYKSSIQTD